MTGIKSLSYEVRIGVLTDDAVVDPERFHWLTVDLGNRVGWGSPEVFESDGRAAWIVWKIQTSKGELANASAIMHDHLGGQLISIQVRQMIPMSAPAAEAVAAAVASLPVQAMLKQYRPTMDAHALHWWVQDLIERITGSYVPENHL